MRKDNSDPVKTASGLVTNALPNTMFRVKIEGVDSNVLVHLSGKMRLHRIKVMVGDHVRVELDDYDPGRGRIIQRM